MSRRAVFEIIEVEPFFKRLQKRKKMLLKIRECLIKSNRKSILSDFCIQQMRVDGQLEEVERTIGDITYSLDS